MGTKQRRKESVLKPAKSEMDVSNEQGVGVKFNSTVLGVGETGDLWVNDNGTYRLYSLFMEKQDLEERD